MQSKACHPLASPCSQDTGGHCFDWKRSVGHQSEACKDAALVLIRDAEVFIHLPQCLYMADRLLHLAAQSAR